eukprot:6962244-Alexandrium_andersonii.AAC.1
MVVKTVSSYRPQPNWLAILQSERCSSNHSPSSRLLSTPKGCNAACCALVLFPAWWPALGDLARTGGGVEDT